MQCFSYSRISATGRLSPQCSIGRILQQFEFCNRTHAIMLSLAYTDDIHTYEYDILALAKYHPQAYSHHHHQYPVCPAGFQEQQTFSQPYITALPRFKYYIHRYFTRNFKFRNIPVSVLWKKGSKLLATKSIKISNSSAPAWFTLILISQLHLLLDLGIRRKLLYYTCIQFQLCVRYMYI